MASIGDLMIANWVYWRRVRGANKRIFATMKLTIDAIGKISIQIFLYFLPSVAFSDINLHYNVVV
jgi:hypothetical protein